MDVRTAMGSTIFAHIVIIKTQGCDKRTTTLTNKLINTIAAINMWLKLFLVSFVKQIFILNNNIYFNIHIQWNTETHKFKTTTHIIIKKMIEHMQRMG